MVVIVSIITNSKQKSGSVDEANEMEWPMLNTKSAD